METAAWRVCYLSLVSPLMEVVLIECSIKGERKDNIPRLQATPQGSTKDPTIPPLGPLGPHYPSLRESSMDSRGSA